jgi:uncharacterized Zn finger protein (UPF0148 family)
MAESPSCPQCGASIQQDFGVITCASCGTVVMVDFDGQVQRMNSTAEVNPPIEPEFAEQPSPVFADEYSPIAEPSNSFQEPSPSQENIVEEPINPELPVENSLVETSQTGDSAANSGDSNPEYQDMFPEPITGSNAIAEITAYANSNSSDSSPLAFSLVVEGIDNADIKNRFVIILEEPKLRLDVNELIKKISNGRLKIEALNPAKIVYIVGRLRSLPVRVTWRQHVY